MKRIYLAGLFMASSLLFTSCGESGGNEKASGSESEELVNDLSFTVEGSDEVYKLTNPSPSGSSSKRDDRSRTEIKIEGDNGSIMLMFNFAAEDAKVGEYPVIDQVNVTEETEALISYYIKYGDMRANCCGKSGDITSSGTVKITSVSKDMIKGEINAKGIDKTMIKGKFATKL